MDVTYSGDSHLCQRLCSPDSCGELDGSSENMPSDNENEEEVWDPSDTSDTDCCEFESNDGPLLPTKRTNASPDQQKVAIVQWILIFLLRLQTKHYIPDSAINALLKFLAGLFMILGTFCSSLTSYIPNSVGAMRKYLDLDDDFVKYVVCSKCKQVYTYDECTACRICQFREFPRQRRCDTPLLRTVEFASGRKIQYPFQVYCYKKLLESLQQLLCKPGFTDLCEQWRLRTVPSNELHDIYDGNIWKEFQTVNGVPFLSERYSYGISINIDWFKPFKHEYSVGVIYLILLNLPRNIRYKQENVIIVGIIPGPREPSCHMINSYLRPLVKELKLLWKGVKLNVYDKVQQVVVRAAVLCVCCDLPAGRKVCGFLSYTAHYGCSRCMKFFPGGFGDAKDYSGFERSKWTPRSNEQHRQDVEDILSSRTKSERDELESKHGCRDSVLLKLPYFDPPRFLAIDPMHNLYLGSAKRMTNIWFSEGLIVDSQLPRMQEFINNFVTPSDVGRIPKKIESHMGGFTADQYKNWVNIYSIAVLCDVLAKDHLECWRHFVLASRILSKLSLTPTDIVIADALLVHFCRRVEYLYGSEAVTPNMHMSCHLKQVLEDYGPVHGFWLFAFERYNGILESQPTNKKCIEPQLMKRFIRDIQSSSLDTPNHFQEELGHLLPTPSRLVGSVSETYNSYDSIVASTSFQLPTRYKRAVFNSSEVAILQKLIILCKLDSDLPQDGTMSVNSIFRKYQSITLQEKCYGSSGRGSTPFVAMAKYDESIFGSLPALTRLRMSHVPECNFWPVNVHYYAKLTYHINSEIRSCVFAAVSWLGLHPDRNHYGKPVQIWCSNMYKISTLGFFIPLSNLIVRCAHCVTTHVNGEHVRLVVPLVE